MRTPKPADKNAGASSVQASSDQMLHKVASLLCEHGFAPSGYSNGAPALAMLMIARGKIGHAVASGGVDYFKPRVGTDTVDHAGLVYLGDYHNPDNIYFVGWTVKDNKMTPIRYEKIATFLEGVDNHDISGISAVAPPTKPPSQKLRRVSPNAQHS